MENKKQLCASGFLEAYLTDKNGKMRKVYEGKNIINQSVLDAIADEIGTSYNSSNNIALDSLFTGSTYAADYKDGIVCLTTDGVSVYYGNMGMATTITQPAANQFRATGVFTNGFGETIIMTAPQLGKSWVRVLVPGAPALGDFNDFVIAQGGMSPQTVPDGATLTIVWTITFTVH